MLSINGSKNKEVLLLSELHKLLGFIFLDEVLLSYKEVDENTSLPQILIRPISAGKEGLQTIYFPVLEIISSDILIFIEENFSMSKEKYLKLDHLKRPVETFEEQTQDYPDIDIEITRLRDLIEEFLRKNKIKFEKSIFPPEPIVCLTHDVDSLKGRSIFRVLGWLIRGCINLDLYSSIKRSFRLFLDRTDHLDSLETCSKIEKSFGLRSTFFFLSLPFFLSHEGRRYRINKRRYKQSIKDLINDNFEVALHTSRLGYKKKPFLSKEKKRLRNLIGTRNLQGVRNHYLSGNFPKIWEVYEGEGLNYDSSLGWSTRLGYRAKTSNPFQPLNLTSGQPFKLVEFPLIFMDTAVEDNGVEYIYNECKFFIDQAETDRSVLTILWHTDRVCNPEYTNFSEAYLRILELLSKRRFVSKTCSEVCEMYQDHVKKLNSNLQING